MSLIILPNQLFPIKMIKEKIEDLKKVILIEEPRYFTDFNFHRLKLMYHRASMKKYESLLKKERIEVDYIDFKKVTSSFYSKYNKESNYYFNLNNTLSHQTLTSQTNKI